MVFIIIALIICSILLGLNLYCTIEENLDWWGVFFSLIAVIIQVICLFSIIGDKKQDAIRDFEAGKYRKEIIYKAEQVDNHMTIYDSTVVYKPILYK